jgi:hypothetical protein
LHFYISVLYYLLAVPVYVKDEMMTFNIITAVAIALLSLAAAYILAPPEKYRKVFAVIVFMAVLARLFIVFYIYRNGTDTFGSDGLLYHQEGIRVASRLSEGASLFGVDYEYTWYTVFIGLVYSIFGINRYLISFINIAFTFISGMLLLKLALNHKYGFPNAALISLVFLFFPNLALWTADSRKEALLIMVCFLGWFSVQNFISSVKRGGSLIPDILRILFICLLMWFSTLIRIYMFIPLFLGVITSQLFLYIKTKCRLCLLFISAAVLCAVLIFTSVMLPLSRDYHAVDFSEAQSENLVQDASSKIAVVGSIASDRNVLLSILDYLVLPLPGSIDIADIKSSPRIQLLVQLDMAAWYICLFLVLTGIYKTIKSRDSCFMGLLAYITAYVLINALVVENVSDTILRYRSIIVGLIILFIDGNVIKDIFRRLGNLFRGEPTSSYLFRH